MKAEIPSKMNLTSYLRWISTPDSKKASLKAFFPNGVLRTINIIKNKATPESVAKWRSFGARHYASYKVNPTKKRRYALKNWGFAIPKNPSERDNL